MNCNIESISSNQCTGCSACQNVCPVDAICMMPDDEGFIMPVIDGSKCIHCGKCYMICPVVHLNKTNRENPLLYAAMANDEVRAVSSSGGMFTLASNVIFQKGGVVCGAAFDDNFRVHHCFAENEEQLSKLRGSKYVQSDIDMIYREVRDRLDRDVPVLFTGTPCQIAGLKSFLEMGEGKQYDNLFTIDILCHGVPSQKIFDKYLKEMHGEKLIRSLSMRDKSLGWRCDLIKVTFQDGTEYIGNLRNDVFEIGFQHNIFLRKSCADCKFCDFPRQGDISIGDFWDINKHDADLNDKKGLSIVFVNNERGDALFHDMRNLLYRVERMEISHDQINNRIHSYYPQHPHRDRFFELIREYSMKYAVMNTFHKKYDVGIVGIYTVGNFGGALTYYALYHTVKDLGYTALMIERPKNSPHKPALRRIYTEDPYPLYEKAELYETKADMRVLNQHCDIFLVGSDQMFNDHLYHNFGEWVTLDWVNDNKKKIAYAASFGHDYIWSPDNTRSEMAYFMKKFDAFSVREESGVDICRKEYGVSAQWVLDPVFLCDMKYYEELISSSEVKLPEHYLGAYILDLNLAKENVVKYISEQLKLPMQIYSEMDFRNMPQNGWSLPILDSCYINDRIQNIARSDFFITDSFHGVCVAILFKRNFVAIVNKRRGASRFQTILSKLGLMDRLVESEDDIYIRPDILKPIDWKPVYEKLTIEKLRCLNWLKTELSVNVKKPYSDYDLWSKTTREQNLKIASLQSEINELRKNNNILMDILSYDMQQSFWGKKKDIVSDRLRLNDITDIYVYLEQLKKLCQRYTIILTIRDNVGICMNQEIEDLLADIGCISRFNHIVKQTSYIGIIYKGKVMLDKATEKGPTFYSGNLKGMDLEIESKLYKQGNHTSIKINGREQAVNHRGINCVVYYQKSGMVIDSVAFDTHVKEFTCYRN